MTHGFFEATLPTMENGFLRPTWPGFIEVSNRCAHLLKRAVDQRLEPDTVSAELIETYHDAAAAEKRS